MEISKQEGQKNGPANKYAIYQLKSGDTFDELRHCSYANLIKQGKKAYIANYSQAYLGDLLAKDTPYKILQRFTRHLPDGFKGQPLEIGDVIALKQDGVQSAYYIDEVLGTKILIALPAFFTKTEDNTMTVTRGVEEYTEEQRHKNLEHAGRSDENMDVPEPEPRVIDGRRSVLDGLKIKKEKVKAYRPPEKRDDKDKDKEMGMDI